MENMSHVTNWEDDWIELQDRKITIEEWSSRKDYRERNDNTTNKNPMRKLTTPNDVKGPEFNINPIIGIIEEKFKNKEYEFGDSIILKINHEFTNLEKDVVSKLYEKNGWRLCNIQNEYRYIGGPHKITTLFFYK